MKQSLMQESGWPNLTRNIMKGTCQKSDVQGVITIPWSVLSESPPKALSSWHYRRCSPIQNMYVP